MESQTQKALQIEFDEILTCIKPFYLNWKSLSEKTIMANWIKKLAGIKYGTTDLLHLRNLYILGLYDNLKKGVLQENFHHNPPEELQPLPTALKNMLLDKFSAKLHSSPSWLDTDTTVQKVPPNSTSIIADLPEDYEEDDYVGDFKFTTDTVRKSILNSSCFNEPPTGGEGNGNESRNGLGSGSNQKMTSGLGDSYLMSNSSSYLQKGDTVDLSSIFNFMDCGKEMGDGSLFNTNNCRGSSIEDFESKFKPSDSVMNKVQEKEILLSNISGMERRLIQLQNAYHEDILKLRSQHEAEVQSLISRKNIEVDQLKIDLKQKLEAQEERNHQLEDKVTLSFNQLQELKEVKNKEINQLKKTYQENMESQCKQYEKKINALFEDFQKEKEQIEMENKRREESISKETQDYFTKWKSELSDKNSQMVKELARLEKDLNEIRSTKTSLEEKNEKLEMEKAQLQNEFSTIKADYSELQNKYQFMENQSSRITNSRDDEIKAISDALDEATLKYKTCKEDVEAKYKSHITSLEAEIEKLHSKIKEANRSRMTEIENLTFSYNLEKNRLRQAHDSELEESKSQLKTTKSLLESKVHEMEKQLELKELQMNQYIKEHEMKEKMTNQMLADIKQDMNRDAERQLKNKQYEMEQLELEMQREVQEKSKEVTELLQKLSNQKQESEQRLSDVRNWSDNQISNLTFEWNQEKAQLEQDYQTKLARTNSEHQRILEENRTEFEKKTSAMQVELKIVKKNLFDKSSELESNKAKYEEEIELMNKSNEEEKERLRTSYEKDIENSTKQSEDFRLAMEKRHAENVSQLLSKTNDKLKEIEEEYNTRSMQAYKTINELKNTIESIKEENNEVNKSQDLHFNTMTKKYSIEIENLQKVIKMNLETHKKEVTGFQNQIKYLERQLEKQESESSKVINQIKNDYEGKISRMLPLSVHKDYEETIQSLRTQISLLQQRVSILDEEVNNCHSLNSLSKSVKLPDAFDGRNDSEEICIDSGDGIHHLIMPNETRMRNNCNKIRK